MEGDRGENRESKRPRLNRVEGGELSESDDEGDRKMPAQPTQRPMDTQREILEISDDEGGEAEEVEVLGTRGGGGGAAATAVPPPSTSSSPSWAYVPDRRTLPLLPYYLIEVSGRRSSGTQKPAYSRPTHVQSEAKGPSALDFYSNTVNDRPSE
jgi:hypothetical protein